jgi:hypothetical protein
MNDMPTDPPQPLADEASFRTYGRHMRLAHRLGLELRQRPPGFRERPELVRLDVEPGHAPSGKAPVRIYVGTEPAQHRAERVLLWSIMKVRDPSRVYEIHLMKDLAGFDRRRWKTGFTGYRYAIPALAGGDGRAIYNDVDQIYLADPAELFDLDMRGAGMLSITERETSVMLLDCARMSRVWRLDDARTMRLHKEFRTRTAAVPGLSGPLGGEWNARDFEYRPGRSKLLHFTILHTQPWQPFPKQLKYEPHALAELWLGLEREADANGFTIFTRERPSRRFRQVFPERDGGSAEKREQADVERLAAEAGCRSVAEYDPASGELTNSRQTAGEAGDYDAIVAAPSIRRVPGDDLPWVLDEMFRAAGKFVYVAVPRGHSFLPAAGADTDDPDWWRSHLEGAARRHPGIRWALRVGRRMIGEP